MKSKKIKSSDSVTLKSGKSCVRIRLNSGNFTKEELQSIAKFIENIVTPDKDT